MSRGAMLLALLLAGCVRHKPAPVPQPHYVVGAGYQAGDVWYYPQEDFAYDQTGLAAVLADRTGLTADGEAFDGSALAAAHQTLQLPAIAMVTNLDTGLQLALRINDRGPASPARLLGLTRRAAELLGIRSGGVAPVRVQVQDGPSQALRDSLGGGRLPIAAAPRAAVAAESLAPPAGTDASRRFRVAAASLRMQETAGPAAPPPPRMPEVVARVPTDPGQLWIRAGQFGRATYANQIQAKLYGLPARVETVRDGASVVFRVKAGPFPSVSAADDALDQAQRDGVTDARIVVE